ncbi:TIGR01244 family sulfur transferase [Terricaulis sp.]|uniref:TIGR01244 family sulfur transferase n=1 Tax=Terricaulis sp. TaxID=2768686 RepID=UPI002AC6E47E|nr:TIGR01244 family sulfur transferase [Terricaulis sp.]MDZ4691652.1 TIGR01244 family sulfur transferase [Terricaulis sp.]
MTEFHRVTPAFAAAGQLSPDDFARAAAEGFRTVIVNRPEGEEPGQPSLAEMRAAAEAAGLAFHAVPFSGLPPPPQAVGATAELLETAEGPILAYCRTGKRSIMAWAMAQALRGGNRPDEIIALAAKAGYDLEGARGALETLAPKT